MSLAIVIDGMKYKFSIEFGWYKGNDFMLFDFQLLNFYTDGAVYLFQLQIAKFVIGLYVGD